MLIGGEAGIGKTTLAEELCHEAEAHGALVLVGRCYDLTETPPYGPFTDLFTRYQPANTPPPLPPAFARRGTVQAVASQAELFGQVQDFLTALTRARPVLVLLDDLHWADAASLDLLRFLVRFLAGLPLLIIVAYRADELTRRHPLYQLLPVLVREARAHRIDLQRIDAADIGLLITDRYGLPAAEITRLTDYLAHRSEGNPFFLGELLHTLEAERVLDRTADGWTLGDLAQTRVPVLLRQVIDGRLTQLETEAQRLLAVAAVIGHTVPLALWAAVANTDEETVAAAIEQATDARVLEAAPGGDARFVHALIREALYDGLVPIRRRGWHRQVAEHLVLRPDPDPDAVAYHFQQAGDERAADWLIRAGDRAKRAYAWLTAMERYEAALALMDRAGTPSRERGWLLYRLSQAIPYSDPKRSQAYLDEAMRHATSDGDRALLALATFNRGLARCFAEDYRRGLADLEAGGAALEALSAAEIEHIRQEDAQTQDVRAGIVFWLARLGRCDEAIAIGERASAGYHGLRDAYATMGRSDDAVRAFERLRDRYYHDPAGEHSTELGFAVVEQIGWVTLPYHSTDLTERARLADEGEGAYRRARGAWSVDTSGWARMPLLFIEGAWDDAERVALAWSAARRSGRVSAHGILGPLARQRGEPETAWALIRDALPAGLETIPGEARFLDALAIQRLAAALAIDDGDTATAQAWLEAHDRWLAWNGAVLGRSEGLLLWARYYRAAGDTERANDHAQQALAAATEPRQPLALLAAHRLLGELDTDVGRYTDAERELGDALSLAEACAAPFERALTLLALADLQIVTDKRTDADASLAAVRLICTPLRAKLALARADAIALTLTTQKEAAPLYPAGLSAREVEVLQLVATGLTNAQVAERLFLSPRTINAHLTTIYSKLGVPSRSAAVRFALEHGLH